LFTLTERIITARVERPRMQDSPRVKSDRTLFSILGCIRENGPVRLGEIAEEIGIAKSTVHNHLSELRHRNFVTMTPEGYDLGLQLLDYGLESRRRQDIYDQGCRKANELAETTGERSWCVVEEHGRAVYLCGASGHQSIEPPEQTGIRQPLHCLAAGKAIMAHLPEDRIDAIVEKYGLEEVTKYTITDRDELGAELESIRENGVAYNLQENIVGAHAIGAPVLDTDGAVFGAISIAGPANRLTEDQLETDLKDLIRGATNEVAVNIRT